MEAVSWQCCALWSSDEQLAAGRRVLGQVRDEHPDQHGRHRHNGDLHCYEEILRR